MWLQEKNKKNSKKVVEEPGIEPIDDLLFLLPVELRDIIFGPVDAGADGIPIMEIIVPVRGREPGTSGPLPVRYFFLGAEQNEYSSGRIVPARRLPFHGANPCAFHLAESPRVSLPDRPGQIHFRNGHKPE